MHNRQRWLSAAWMALLGVEFLLLVGAIVFAALSLHPDMSAFQGTQACALAGVMVLVALYLQRIRGELSE